MPIERSELHTPLSGGTQQRSLVSDAARTILHIDMDAFFASVEQRDNPALRGQPILVGGAGPRAVVTTASYEARPFGCRSAMPMAQARRLCPRAIVVPGRYSVYSAVSKQVMAVLDEFSPDVQRVGIDEAFVEVTTVKHLHGDGLTIAAKIRRRVREVVSLPCSVGVAPNKSLAKLASDLGKPDGIKEIGVEDVDRVLAPLGVGVLYTVGPKAVEALAKLGVRTIADLRAADAGLIAERFGDVGRLWLDLAWGRDERAVHGDEPARSIGKEQTFGTDVDDADALRATLLRQVEDVSSKARTDELVARRIVVKLRTGDFKTFSRSATLTEPTAQTDAIWPTARGLFDAWWQERRHAPGGSSRTGDPRRRRALRLIGVTLQDLSVASTHAAGLFDAVASARPSGEAGTVPGVAKRAKVDAVTDAIRAKFGKGAVGRAGGLG